MIRLAWRVATMAPLAVAFSDVIVGVDRVENAAQAQTSESPSSVSSSATPTQTCVVLSRRWFRALDQGTHICFRSPFDPSKTLLGRVIDIRSNVLVVPPADNDRPRSGFIRHNQVIVDGFSSPVPQPLVIGRPIAVLWPPSKAQLL